MVRTIRAATPNADTARMRLAMRYSDSARGLMTAACPAIIHAANFGTTPGADRCEKFFTVSARRESSAGVEIEEAAGVGAELRHGLLDRPVLQLGHFLGRARDQPRPRRQ